MKRAFFTPAKTARFLGMAIVSLALSSCLEKDLYDPATNGNGEIGKVTLEDYNDYSTRQNVQLNIDYGEENPKAYFEVYAENPLQYEKEGGQIKLKEGLVHIASGFTDAKGMYTGEVPIPASVTEAYIYSSDFGVPTLYKTAVSGKEVKAKITFENQMDVALLSQTTRNAQTRAVSVDFITKVVPNVLGTWNSNNGAPNYLVPGKKIEVDNKLKSYMTSYFPEGKNNKGPLVSKDADIVIKKDAHVTINYFGGTTAAKSVFAYYCYPENATLKEIEEASKHACVIFPNAHSNALKDYSGVAVDLKYINKEGVFPTEEPERFPAGTKIGFLIWNNAWAGTNATSNNLFYSTQSLNKDKRSHTAIFAAKNKKEEKFNIITMEDWNDNDYNDVAFVISSDPITAIEVPDVPNPGDRFGTDTYCGLLCFEDNWPSQGDYDLNDVMLKYETTVDFNSDNKVLNIVDNFSLIWTGALYRNGFAYEVPFDLSKAKVSLSAGSSSYSGNVITLFTDAKKELGVSDVAPEDMASQDIREMSYTVSMAFDDAKLDKTQAIAPYNPFIRIRNSNKEVHPVNYKPTANADNTFPDGVDISLGAQNGTYFICEDGYPFAIHLDARLDKTLLDLNLKNEGVRIDEAYPKFKEWAKTRDPQVKWW